MSSNFGAQNAFLQVLPHSEADPTFFAPGTGEIQKQSEAPRNRFHPSTGRSSCIQNHSQNALPQVPAGCKTRGIAFPSRIAFPQVLAVPKRIMTMSTMRFPSYWRESRRNRIHPSMGISRTHRMHHHEENALPQVLTEFRINQRHGGIAFHQTTPTSGIQNQSTAWRNRFPQSTGGSWTHRAGWPFPGCGVAGRCEERNTVFAKGSKLGRSH